MSKKDPSAVDLFGIAASAICAIHCLATSAVIALLPQYGGDLWKSDLVHQVCAVFVMFFCIASIYRGYRKHSDMKVMLLFVSGLIFIVTATFLLPESVGEFYETVILCTGSFTMIAAHVLNIWRATHCCSLHAAKQMA